MGRKTNLVIKIIVFLFFSVVLTVGNSDDAIFKKQVNEIKELGKVDIIFLIDGSSSVGLNNFESELNFVKKLLSDFEVSENGSRVSVVVYGSNAIIYEHQDKCELLNSILPTINYPGSNTNTLGAFLAARELLQVSSRQVHKVIFLVTDGFSNGGDPTPIAEALKKEYNITIFTLGIQNGNRRELEALSSSKNTSYLLQSFSDFDLLARRALHTDLKEGEWIRLEEAKCGGCDQLAICTCGTTSGQYSCRCLPGYFGSGKSGDCTACPNGTYDDRGTCIPCPDVHHVTKTPAVSIEDCICKAGYTAPSRDPHHCEVLRCPKLRPPENGYFVGKTSCSNVLNSACGVRCNVGYSLRGTSIRICRETGHWDGLEPQCHLKTCPRPPIPVGGEVFCNNTDLDINYTSLPDEMPTDTECFFNCEEGSNLIGSTKRTCLPIEQWDGLKTTCKPIKCIKIPRIPHGKVSPGECSREKQRHGARCNITCAEGFSGPGELECTSKGRHGAWSHKPRCIDTTPPRITCPGDIQTVSLPGQNFALVHWEPPSVEENSKSEVTLWWEPVLDEEEKTGPWKFEIGETLVTYYAVDSSGNAAFCNFTVLVQDLEPPRFICEDPPPYLIGVEGVPIEWDEPQVADNSGGDVSVFRSREWGPLPIGRHQVEYTAVDLFNNSGRCLLNITVIKTTCEDELPDIGATGGHCSGLQCVLTCEEGYAFSMTDRAICDANYATWTVPECTPTELPEEISGSVEKECVELQKTCLEEDCVLLECEDHSRRLKRRRKRSTTSKFRIRLNQNFPLEERFKGATLNITCRPGSVPPRGGTSKKRCVKCPRGTFHNTTSNSCEGCPLNHYNDRIGASTCRECPPGTLTRRTGSKGLKACKIPIGGKFRSIVRKKPCRNDTCLHGRCLPVGVRHRCQCDEGWVGVRCRQRRVDHCKLEPCLNGGRCTPLGDGYSCTCPGGFTGSSCELEEVLDDPPTKVNICEQVENLCENGGVCQPKLRGDYRCLCPPGFLGRRCQNVPCDYRPCPDTTVCVNVLEDGVDTTRKSYRCDCPEGKMNPPTCLEDTPVQSGGSAGGECPKGSFGRLCQERVSQDFVLEFTTSGTSDYALLEGPKETLQEFTFCLWLQTNNTFNYGTILSYATKDLDNSLTLIDYSGLVLWVNGKYAVTNLKVNDGHWHHVCISWQSSNGTFQIYLDSSKKASGSGLSVAKPIKGGGIFVLGQDQDTPGGGFSTQESYVGKIAYLDLWNRTLDPEEMVHKCGEYSGGNYVSWVQFWTGIKGRTKVSKSDFCHTCKAPSSIPGGTWKMSKNGSSLTLNCHRGYVIHIHGSPNPMTSITRQCLASGSWQDEPTPISCAKVYCAPPPRIRHTRITNRRRVWRYGDVAQYQCLGGFRATGPTSKTCSEGGRWTNETFECIGASCPSFEVPKGANVSIISEHVYDEDFHEIRSFDIGTTIEISCLEQSVIMTCLEGQRWDKEVPKCQKVDTTTPKPVENTLEVPKGSKDSKGSKQQKIEEPSSKLNFTGSSTEKSASKSFLELEEVTTSRQTSTEAPRQVSVELPPSTTPKLAPSEAPVAPEVFTTARSNPNGLESSPNAQNGTGSSPKAQNGTESSPRARNGTDWSSKGHNGTESSPRARNGTGSSPKAQNGTGTSPKAQNGTESSSKAQNGTESSPKVQNVTETSSKVQSEIQSPPKAQNEAKLSPKEAQSSPAVSTTPSTSKVTSEAQITASEVTTSEKPTSERPPLLEEEKRPSVLQEEKKDTFSGLKLLEEKLKKMKATLDEKPEETPKNTSGDASNVKETSTEALTAVSQSSNGDTLDQNASGLESASIVGKHQEDLDQAGGSSTDVVTISEVVDTSTLESKIADGCEGVSAPAVPNNGYLENGDFDNLTLYEVGTTFSFKCRSGYDLIGTNFTSCLPSGDWSDPEISCEPVRCPYPPKYLNMYPRKQPGMQNLHFGNMVSYDCELGFTFYGNNVVRCQANGRWSRIKGKCARISCGKPVLSSEETIIGSSYLYKDSLHVMCPTGSARNHYEAKCTHSGQWLFIGNCHTPEDPKSEEG